MSRGVDNLEEMKSDRLLPDGIAVMLFWFRIVLGSSNEWVSPGCCRFPMVSLLKPG